APPLHRPAPPHLPSPHPRPHAPPRGPQPRRVRECASQVPFPPVPVVPHRRPRLPVRRTRVPVVHPDEIARRPPVHLRNLHPHVRRPPRCPALDLVRQHRRPVRVDEPHVRSPRLRARIVDPRRVQHHQQREVQQVRRPARTIE